MNIKKHLLFSLLFCVGLFFTPVPTVLAGSSQIFTEKESGSIVNLTKDQEVIFSLNETYQNTYYWSHSLIINPTILGLSSIAEQHDHQNPSVVLTRDFIFFGASVGQTVLVFVKTEPDATFPLVKSLIFIVNVRDPAAGSGK